MYFKNKTVWITGASSGIGEALAAALARQGARLILSGRNEKELRRVQRICLNMTEVVEVQVLDLERYKRLSVIVQQVQRKFPKIDILINNAGISQRSFATETSISVDKRLMDINYMGTVALTKAVLPSMLKHQLGQVVVVTSLVGKFGTPYRSSYAASKHALHGFFDSLRAELRQQAPDIRITLICPGYIRTHLSYNALTGNGNPQNSMDDVQADGMDSVTFARKALRAIAKGKREVYIAKKEVLGVYIHRFFPTFFAKLVAKVKVK